MNTWAFSGDQKTLEYLRAYCTESALSRKAAVWITDCGEACDPSGEYSIDYTKDDGGGSGGCEMVTL